MTLEFNKLRLFSLKIENRLTFLIFTQFFAVRIFLWRLSLLWKREDVLESEKMHPETTNNLLRNNSKTFVGFFWGWINCFVKWLILAGNFLNFYEISTKMRSIMNEFISNWLEVSVISVSNDQVALSLENSKILIQIFPKTKT